MKENSFMWSIIGILLVILLVWWFWKLLIGLLIFFVLLYVVWRIFKARIIEKFSGGKRKMKF